MEGKGRGGGAQAADIITATTSTTTTSSTTNTTPEVVVVEQHHHHHHHQQQQQQQGPRRRAGALKRKANNSTSSTPAKRLARERPLVPLPPLHNGPITRARQSPNKFAISAAEAAASASAAASSSSASLPQNPAEPLPNPVFYAAGEVITATEESNAAYEEVQPDLEPVIDAEFEAIRSRDDNAHAIPTHAGWFSWTKVHPLEEHALASFFNEKSEKRTPDVYMEIRNLIVEKFHEESKTQIEPKDLSEFSVGDLDARQEIMEFLDHWGLINFQPFPLADSGTAAPDANGADKTASLIEKLYRFETVQSHLRVSSRADLAAPIMPPRLFPESSIAEEVRPEGPSVEYHCNSCSADCSRKRYHCQKQADFDLCSECYNNGKFNTGMSHADFILMESAEVPGVSGGSWTDQETLLLLEALELFGENWSEIAEHVATKTKAQCILHFVQMPIEDSFFEVKDDVDARLQANIVPGSTGNDSSGLKDAPETRDNTVEVNTDSASVKSTPETTEGKSAITSDSSALKDAPETTQNESANKEQPLSSPMDISKPSDASEVKLAQEMSANTALNALKEAFQAVGSLPEPGEKLSFAEAGNPVMALAAYLAGLVEPDVAAASARSSLKTISEESPGIQLAARHCFILEDSPDSGNATPAIESADVEMADKEVQKDEDQKEENHQEETHTSVLDGSSVPKNWPDKKMEEAIQEEKESSFSSGDEGKENSNAAKRPDDETILPDGTPSAVKERGDSASSPREDPPSTVTESVDMPLPAEVMQSSMKESSDGLGEASECPEAPKAVDMVSNSVPSEEKASGEASKCPETPKAVDTLSNSVPLEEKESQHTVASSLTVQNGANSGKDDIKLIDCKEEKNCDLAESKDDHNINRIKRAAITALSAAAVKAKLLANQEEDQIRQITTLLIEKQLQKLEIKLSYFTEMESMITRVREHLDRSRQRLYQERAQIIASRLGLPASSSRTVPPTLATNRVAMSYVNSFPRPQPGMNFQRLPVKTPAPHLSSSSVPSTVAGASPHISHQEKLSSLGTS